MKGINFANREHLRALGLNSTDIEAFIKLRTTQGELSSATFETAPDGFSEKGAQILLEAFNESDDWVKQLQGLRITLNPKPPVAAIRPAKIIIRYTGDIDQELRTIDFEITMRGPSQINFFDVSYRHVIDITFRHPNGEILSERVAIPITTEYIPSNSIANSLDEWPSTWTFDPMLTTNESWDTEGYVYMELNFPTRTAHDVPTISDKTNPRISRKGRYTVPGSPNLRFDKFTFSFAFVDAYIFNALPSLFKNPQESSAQRIDPMNPAFSVLTNKLTFRPGTIDFEGVFKIGPSMEQGISASGWVWLLTGEETYVGFVPDEDLYTERPDIVITLPAGVKDESKTDIPYNFTEKGLLEHPEIFASEVGTSCQPFNQPGRVLGERRFYTILRATQPNVRGAGNTTIYFDDELKRPIDYPRTFISRNNRIEYDGENQSLYQALTVSVGHILEFAVKYRSNGYSLGDVAHSLTLAPRQKRRVIKLDYERRERNKRVEDTMIADEVSDGLHSARSYDAAVQASLSEWARGHSKSSVNSATVGGGFALPGFIIGGGAATSAAGSSSSQEGGRRAAANETQQLRDAIRRWGESTRALNSTVIQEVEQSEEIEGVSEVIQNINYTRSLSVIYYDILRHIRVDTQVAGVTECIFVPMRVSDFTDERIKYHSDVLRRYARGVYERIAFQNLEHLPNKLDRSDIPEGKRSDQILTTLTGSLYLRVGLEMPGEGEVADAISAATDQVIDRQVTDAIHSNAFSIFSSFLPSPVTHIISQISNATTEERNRYFQREIAPHMVRRYVNELRLLREDGSKLKADFTLSGSYVFGKVLKVDFTVDLLNDNVRRADLVHLVVKYQERFFNFGSVSVNTGTAPELRLPPRSFMNVTRAVLRYGNEHYDDICWSDKGERDLVNSVTGHADPNGGRLVFKPKHSDHRNLRKLVEDAYNNFKARIQRNPFFYHKAVWWSMDRDELYALLDGFSLKEAKGRSIASIIERRPIGILGNCLVFRTTTVAPLDPMFKSFETLKNYYTAGLPPSDPIRVSLPTAGLYARAHMDGCVAAEEHDGSFAWVFNSKEPELANLPDSMFTSRRAEPQDMTPANMPSTIINLQNTPDRPSLSGLSDALNAVQNSSAFRDVTGLEGTQSLAKLGLEKATGLANGLGNMAFQGAIAQLAADSRAASDLKGFFSAIEKARDNGLITPEQATRAANDYLLRRATGKDVAEDEHRREMEKMVLDSAEGGTVVNTDSNGTKTVKKNPSSTPKNEDKPKKPVGYVKWLEGERGKTDLLLYNFEIGKDSLHPEHKKALEQISVQIEGVDDITVVEGRASKSKTKSDDSERTNKAISLRRMVNVWSKLMEYAFDPQSNEDKQIYKGADNPVRRLYSDALSRIDEGSRNEDPVERSVLIKLAKKIDSKIKPEPAELPDIPQVPQISTYGHIIEIITAIGTTFRLFWQGGDRSLNFSKDGNKSQVMTGIISEGDNSPIIQAEGNSEVVVTINNHYKTNIQKPSKAGDKPKITIDSIPTQEWQIEISNPRASGDSISGLFETIKDFLSVIKTASELVDTKIMISGEANLKIPGVVGAKGSISLGTNNLPGRVVDIAEKVLDALADENNLIGKTLNGLVIGTAFVDVEVSPMFSNEPDLKSISKKGTVNGPGFYFAREFDQVSDSYKLLARFLYRTKELRKLSDWGVVNGINDVSIKFYSSSSILADDTLRAFRFIKELYSIFDNVFDQGFSSNDITSKIGKLKELVELIGNMSDFTNSDEGLTFESPQDNSKTIEKLNTGQMFSIFKVEGLIKMKE